jgi:uncharacterized protein (TIGR02391 family)
MNSLSPIPGQPARPLSGIPRKPAVIVRNPGQPDESRTEVLAHLQPSAGFFDVTTPIYEGDVVESEDPRGGVQRHTVQTVKVFALGTALDHIEVSWGPEAPARVAAVRRLGLDGLHADILKASSDLFTDAHYDSAVFEAFKRIESRVRMMTQLEASGADLMARAFRDDPLALSVSRFTGRTGRDEQTGYRFLFMGASSAIRNPPAHEPPFISDPQVALEYLAFASLLMRVLDRI